MPSEPEKEQPISLSLVTVRAFSESLAEIDRLNSLIDRAHDRLRELGLDSWLMGAEAHAAIQETLAILGEAIPPLEEGEEDQ